jgi:hypothetical protein
MHKNAHVLLEAQDRPHRFQVGLRQSPASRRGFIAGLCLALLAALALAQSVPASRPALRPATKPASRPATMPASRPASNPASRPASQGAPTTLSAWNPYEGMDAPTGECEIDKLVFARLAKLGVRPAHLCSDSVFVRRVYLDAIGTVPTAQEAADFIKDTRPDKRRILIDALLDRPEFADYRSMKWSDLLRVKAEFPINLWPKAVQMYHHWIWENLKDNRPYDQFVRQMLLASGSNFVVPEVNFYRAMQSKEPQAIAQTVALTFMGARADKWPKERLAGMGAFFARLGSKSTQEWKEEIIFFDLARPVSATEPAAVFPDGTAAHIAPGQDPREAFADWLITPQNPYFTRNIVNRVWYWLLGRGIIHEPDDIRPDNPPSNPELLAYLERELIGAHYDLKHIYRLILNSRTYQLSSIPVGRGGEAEANFAYYPLRRLEAEVLSDAICQITGTTEKYSSPIPEPYTYIPEEQRSIQLADGSTNSTFLEIFGRPPRDSGLESERNNRPTAEQQLHMLNSTHIRQKIENGPKLRDMMQARQGPREAVSSLYLTILSRYPTAAELQTVLDYATSGPARGRDALVDLAWALMNSPEFLYRH